MKTNVSKKSKKDILYISIGLFVISFLFWLVVNWQITDYKEDMADLWELEGDTLIFFVHDDIPRDTIDTDRFIILRFKDRDAVYQRIKY